MNIIIDSKIYSKLTESDSFTYLDKEGENGNYRTTPNSEVGTMDKVDDIYGDKSPNSDTIANMLAPQSYLKTQKYKVNGYNPRSNIKEENGEFQIDDDLERKLNYVINRINTLYKDGNTKANIIAHILSHIDRRNIPGNDKNNLRNIVMQ